MSPCSLRSQISEQGQEEKLSPPKAVCERAENDRPQHRTSEIDRGTEAKLRIGKRKPFVGPQGAGQRPAEAAFQSVEKPGNAERDDRARVPAAPGQCVQTLRIVASSTGAGQPPCEFLNASDAIQLFHAHCIRQPVCDLNRKFRPADFSPMQLWIEVDASK